MKRLLACFLLSAVALVAQVETLDMGPHGRLTLYLLGDWKVDVTNFARQGSITINPTKHAVNASCTINVSFTEPDRVDSKNRLKLRVEIDAMPYAERSVERKPVAREFTLASGYGFYCNFTDAELRGKPPEKGNYKVATVGKIRLSPTVLLDVLIFADGFRDEPYQQLLGAIEGMEFTPGSGG